MSKIDRGLRALVGLAAIALFFGSFIPAPWHWVALAVGVVLLLTSAVGICPAYIPFGWNTCATKKAP